MASVTASETVVRSDEANERQPDWALDPSDPLNLLLNNSNDTDSELSQAATPPDWSQFTSLWPGLSTDAKDALQNSGENTKALDLAAGLDFSFPMDLDFNDASFSVAVDPNSLYLDGKGIQVPVHHAPPIHPQDLLAAPFPFTFSSPSLSSSSTSSPFTDESSRLCSSPTSPGSSSTSTQSAASPIVSAAPKTNAEAIAAFFAQSRPSVQGLITSLPTQSIVSPHLQVESRPSFPSISPSPIPSATFVSEAVPARVPDVLGSTAMGRPKTSHTTIERRYRTNLNARIQSLKAAVPALRVLDQNYKNDEYKVDERGYIDGVKVARKGSKANVLGKAVEYIRVLKRREARLKREQDGLRTLICGFPGGQSILSEWDIEWTKKFGGPERDEIDNLGVEEASDEEDGDGEGEDEGDSLERTRKKQKVDSAPPKKEKRKIAPATPVPNAEIMVTAPGVVPEKRKRGRPRKIQPNIPPPPITASDPVLLTDPSRPPQQGIAVPPMVSQPVQSQQYLLAVFALFSFFNSPLTSSPRHAAQHHTHEGSVLSQVASSSTASFTPASGHLWKDLVQIVHLLASIVVIISIVIPWVSIPRRVSRARILQLIPFSSLVCASRNHVTAAHERMDLPTPPASPDVTDSGSETESMSNDDTVYGTSHARARTTNPLVHALGARGSADEFQNLVNALDVSGGLMGILRCAVGGQMNGQNPLIRHERRAWMRLAELIVLDPEMASLSLRWQVRNRFSSVTGFQGAQTFSTTPVSDLCTLALLELSVPLPYTRARSQTLWKRANDLAESASVPTFERLVFDSMSVDEAFDCLSSSKAVAGLSPIDFLASTLLRRRLRAHLSALFVHCASETEDEDSKVPSAEDSKQWQDTITFSHSLDGPIAVLADAFAKVWRKDDADIEKLEVGPVDEDIRALLSAVVLYRRIFTPQDAGDVRSENSILSPPPSPASKTGHDRDGQSKDMVLHLRRALGSSVFEQRDDTQTDDVSLEDVRDRVVDMLVNLERGRRTRLV